MPARLEVSGDALPDGAFLAFVLNATNWHECRVGVNFDINKIAKIANGTCHITLDDPGLYQTCASTNGGDTFDALPLHVTILVEPQLPPVAHLGRNIALGVSGCALLFVMLYHLCRWRRKAHVAMLADIEMQDHTVSMQRLLVVEAELREVHAQIVDRQSAVKDGRDDGAARVSGSARRLSRSATAGADLRYLVEPHQLIIGRPQQAAQGLARLLKLDDEELHQGLVHAVTSIRREIADFGTDEDKECLDYILNHPAGSSDKKFPNGVRDVGRHGESLSDFVKHPNSVASGLSEGHVVALRLYTSAAFKSINAPLRDTARKTRHPFPVTVYLIAEALKRLRAVAGEAMGEAMGASSAKAGPGTVALWRGMRNMAVTDGFLAKGGSELAPMSATTELAVAMRYALSEHSLLFKIVTKNFMERGVDISYLSCFPEENEHLFPPLTYLRPTGTTQRLTLSDDGAEVEIIEVEPTFGT